MPKVNQIRNVAIIAHVDHGKTTLVDALLKQTHTFRANQEEMGAERIMDSNDLEREKGITILSKNTSVFYKDTKINIIDTPGHADFGGEVERVLNMADGVLLIVDAAEGPLSQTRFVLKKALDYGLKVILVINKIDRKDADVERVMNDTEELFLNLASTSDTLDFPVVYAVGREGKAFYSMPTEGDISGDITPLLDTILESITPANQKDGLPFKMLVSAFEPNQFLGRLAVGRVFQGKIKSGDAVVMLSTDSRIEGNYRIGKMYVNEGIGKVEVTSAECGEIVYLAGIDEIEIGHTLASPLAPQALPTIEVAPPTLKASFGPNSSIFAKAESRFLTSRELKERLTEEARTNLGMKVEMDTSDNIRMIVAGRGELHLAILIEKLRREGYALEVGKPEVILRKVDGQWHEPINEVTILTTDEYVGTISAEMGKRRGLMLDMTSDGKGGVKIIYKISEKNSLGLRTVLMTETKGTTAISSLFLGYEKNEENLSRSRNGVMIATESGKALSYGLDLAQKRGTTFVEPTELIYEGQIVGLRPVSGDLDINVCKGKQLTNMRSSGNDDAIILAPAVKYSIEECLDFIEEDELIDITPKSVRLRKKYLTKVDRTRAERKGNGN